MWATYQMYNSQTHILQVQVLIVFVGLYLSISSLYLPKVFLIPLIHSKVIQKGEIPIGQLLTLEFKVSLG